MTKGKSSRAKAFRAILRLFPPGRIVDLGTGHGGFARLAADEGWSVTAVDARTERWPNDPRIEWVQADLRDHDLSHYDLILCLGVFYHLTCNDQIHLLQRASGTPLVIDTHLDHGEHQHKLSDRIMENGFEGRLYQEPGKTTSSWLNSDSFWPTPAAFYSMLQAHDYTTILTLEPWLESDRTFFVALPDEF